jgi:hypothetical protein
MYSLRVPHWQEAERRSAEEAEKKQQEQLKIQDAERGQKRAEGDDLLLF